MILQASNGCFLTQSEDVAFKERKFEKFVLLRSLEESNKWKEIPESEKEKILAEANLFEPDSIDYAYLGKVNNLLTVIGEKINNASLSPNEALEMQQYYPEWENCIGKEVFAGFRCLYEGTLVEVITPHIISEDKPPVTSPAPMLLSSATSEGANTDSSINHSFLARSVQYFKSVTPEVGTKTH